MLSWQPEFQSDLPKTNMQHFLLPSDVVCAILIKICLLVLKILMCEGFSVVSLWNLLISGEGREAKFDPRGMNGTIYEDDH